MDLELFTTQKDGLILSVKVIPNSRKNQMDDVVLDVHGGKILKMLVTAVPEDGKANTAVIALLARSWRLKKSQILIKQGRGSRNKMVHIVGNSEELLKHLGKY